jgi:hypothetical protein
MAGGVTNWYHSPIFDTEPEWVELTSCRRNFCSELNSEVAEFQVAVHP